MSINIKTVLLSSLLVSLVSGCSTTDEPQSVSNIPQWILNPTIDDGLAATDCVKASGNMSVDSKMAAANARLSLAQQIEIRVSGLDKTYLNRADANDETTVGSTFSSVSKQVTQQKLTGTRIVRSDIIQIAEKDHYCSMVTLQPNETKELFAAIVEKSERKINAQDEQFLYQEFKAFKEQQSLEKEISRLTN